MSQTAWTLRELIATLSTGVPLPGEPTGDPPWPKSFDDEYRRITAANCIAGDFADQSDAMNSLRQYALSGENPDVRCRCVTLLGQKGCIDELVDKLIDDPEPELRLYALEYILVNHPIRFAEVESRLHDDQDWFINETLESFRSGNEIPLYHYEMPDKNALNRSRESSGK
ncbi:MAG: HEAT repeat domain-containing protein [Planctomycetaceae bacterium]